MAQPADYKSSGVDIDAYMQALEKVKPLIKATATPGVVRDVGAFGGIFDLAAAGVKNPYLVSSIDGVGTKLRVAQLAGRFDTIGRDLVFHCCNDIAVQGARPLFFLDYFGTGKLAPAVFEAVIAGLASGCREAGCALIGGETAEMPGLYAGSDFDLVGCIVGLVSAGRVVTGQAIAPGNTLLGIPSSGLHTNGYSLARKILFDRKRYRPDTRVPEFSGTLADELLKVHRLYGPVLLDLMEKTPILGMAHITGGGLPDNVVRILPAGVKAVIEKRTLPRLPVFDFLQREGDVEEAEMYHVFNMGVGMVVAVPAESAGATLDELKKTWPESAMIGRTAACEGGPAVELV